MSYLTLGFYYGDAGTTQEALIRVLKGLVRLGSAPVKVGLTVTPSGGYDSLNVFAEVADAPPWEERSVRDVDEVVRVLTTTDWVVADIEVDGHLWTGRSHIDHVRPAYMSEEAVAEGDLHAIEIETEDPFWPAENDAARVYTREMDESFRRLVQATRPSYAAIYGAHEYLRTPFDLKAEQEEAWRVFGDCYIARERIPPEWLEGRRRALESPVKVEVVPTGTFLEAPYRGGLEPLGSVRAFLREVVIELHASFGGTDVSMTVEN